MSCVERDRRVELKLLGFQLHGRQVLPAGGRIIRHRDGSTGWIRSSDLSVNETWANAIHRLLISLGGEKAVSRLIETLKPERKIVAIYVPFDSPYQENNGVIAEVVQMLASLRLDLDVSPLDFDPRNPSHIAPELY